MKGIVRTSVLCASLAVLICVAIRTQANAQEPGTRPEKFLDPDLASAKGNYVSKVESGALEGISQGTASIPHGIRVGQSRPPCQNTDSATPSNYSSCGLVTVLIPPHVTVDRVDAYARNGGTFDWYPCYSPAQDCAVGWARFVDNYQEINNPNGHQVIWVFSNWSHMLGRDALVVVHWH
jgi:hypothetical protein